MSKLCVECPEKKQNGEDWSLDIGVELAKQFNLNFINTNRLVPDGPNKNYYYCYFEGEQSDIKNLIRSMYNK